MTKLRQRASAMMLLVLLVVTGCSGSGSGTTLAVADAWSRQPPPGVTAAAVYAVITNGTDADRRVVGVSTTAGVRAELHETVIGDNGFATMEPRENGLVVPAGGALALEPGGAHVMVFDVDPEQYDAAIDVVFEFDDGEALTVVAEVKQRGASG